MSSKNIFGARGVNMVVTDLDDGRVRFEASKDSTRFSEAFTKSELMEALKSAAFFLNAPPEQKDDGRFDRVSQVLRDYAASERKTIEDIDRECQIPPERPGLKGSIMSREEYLVKKLGGGDLEAVLRGEMTVAEAIRHQGEDEGGESEEDEDEGDETQS